MTISEDDNRPLSAAEALRRGRSRPTEPLPLPPIVERPADVGPEQPAYDVSDAPVGGPPSGPGDGAGLTWPLAVLGALAVALAISLVLGALSVARHKATDKATVAASQAAQQAAVDVLSADYRQLDKNIKKAESRLTPSFRKDYMQLAQQAFGQLARDNHLLLTSTVTGYGVRSASPDRVVVLVFVDQVSTTVKQTTPKLAQNRVRMTMQKLDGRWLVAKIDAL